MALLAATALGCDVELERQMSLTPCQGNFGCYASNNSMWVREGCRGVFNCNGHTNALCDPCDPGPCPPTYFHECMCTSATPAPAAPKYMLLDDRNVETSTATLALGKVSKHPAGAMIKEERPYEMRFDNMQPNVWYDPELRKWRAWYSTFTSCSKPKGTVPFCNNVPQQCGSAAGNTGGASRGTALLYAESADGFNWTKPDLGVAVWNGSAANNIVKVGGMACGVYLDEAAPPPERYKMTGIDGQGSIAASSDGIRWNRTKDLSPDTHARWDTPHNMVWDQDRGQWLLYLRSKPTESNIRIQSYSHSLTPDFMGSWAPAAPTGLNTSTDYQPDGLVVWPYEGIYLGIGNVFNPTQTTAKSGAAVGQVNMVLGWSPDGRSWKWLLPNDSIIPLGMAGDFDSCGVFAAKQEPLRWGAGNSTLRLYYAGCNGPFFGSRGCALGMATLQRDGWAGYTGGFVVTAPVRVSGYVLQISVSGGSFGVQVGIVGSADYSVDKCDPVKGQQTDAVVSWQGKSDINGLVDGAVVLEFKIPGDAMLFAFSV
eukprot:gene5304-948_t